MYLSTLQNASSCCSFFRSAGGNALNSADTRSVAVFAEGLKVWLYDTFTTKVWPHSGSVQEQYRFA